MKRTRAIENNINENVHPKCSLAFNGPEVANTHHYFLHRLQRKSGIFFFFIFKKIKISKIYVRFEIFQNYHPVALWGATGPKCNFFSSNLQRGSWQKKQGGLSPPPPTDCRHKYPMRNANPNNREK